MEKSALTRLPSLFSLSTNNDYSRFIPKETVQQSTEKRWIAIGSRLYSAIETVEPYVMNYDKTKKQPSETTNSPKT